MLLAGSAMADGDPPEDWRGFHHSTVYVIDGVTIPVTCDCEKEEDGYFIVLIDDVPGHFREAALAGFDFANRVCEAKGGELTEESKVYMNVWPNEHGPDQWALDGICL